MKKLLLTSALLLGSLPALAQQVPPGTPPGPGGAQAPAQSQGQPNQGQPDPNTTLTLTYGELQALVSAQIAQALEQQSVKQAEVQFKPAVDAGKSAMDKVMEQLKKAPASAPAAGAPGAPGMAPPPPPPAPTAPPAPPKQ